MRLGYGMGLPWSQLVLHSCFGAEFVSPQTKDSHRMAIDAMFELIRSFQAERAQRDGLRKILLAYEAFLDGDSTRSGAHPESRAK